MEEVQFSEMNAELAPATWEHEELSLVTTVTTPFS
jgi:hypothetical protein